MVDKIFSVIEKEKIRQQNTIELIASENFVSENVLKAQGSILTNKYAEGYPGKRYYGGCKFVDEIENMAIDCANKLKANPMEFNRILCDVYDSKRIDLRAKLSSLG